MGNKRKYFHHSQRKKKKLILNLQGKKAKAQPTQGNGCEGASSTSPNVVSKDLKLCFKYGYC